jgi:hypothetical protein
VLKVYAKCRLVKRISMASGFLNICALVFFIYSIFQRPFKRQMLYQAVGWIFWIAGVLLK